MTIGESPRTAICVSPVSLMQWPVIFVRVESDECRRWSRTPTVHKSFRKSSA
jgi:hypothetical protein